MNILHQNKTYPRKPFMALLLSLPAPGLGHIYCGKLAKGMIIFFLSFAFVPILIVTALGSKSSKLLIYVAIGSLLFRVILSLYAIIDSFLTAKRLGQDYHLKEYNRWFIYILFIMVSMFGSVNLDMDIRDGIVQAFKIPSTSMVPNIIPRDYVLANKAVYSIQPVQVGDIITFIYPNNRSIYFMKRVVAMPGDRIAMKDNVLYINGEALSYGDVDSSQLKHLEGMEVGKVLEEKGKDTTHKIMLKGDSSPESTFDEITVPNGHCFVMGDNRNKSRDSRHFGPVPLADIVGRVDFIYVPAKSWSRFGHYKD